MVSNAVNGVDLEVRSILGARPGQFVDNPGVAVTEA